MLVYSIAAEIAPIFEDIVPGYVLRSIERPGYFTLGMLSTDGEWDRVGGFLQFYVGLGKKSREPVAVLTWLTVPEEERGEANGWSLLSEMERMLRPAGLSKMLCLIPAMYTDSLKGYLIQSGWEEQKDADLPAELSATGGGSCLKKELHLSEETEQE